MFNNYNIYIVVIILLILVIGYLYIQKNTVYDKLLGGFYEADSSFCDEAGIDMFSLYIESNDGQERSGYILAYKDDEIILNEPVILNINRQWQFNNDPDEVIYYDIDFIGLSDDVIDTFPNLQTIKFYPNIGKIILYYDDTVSAVLYKNGVLSEIKDIIAEDDIDAEE